MNPPSLTTTCLTITNTQMNNQLERFWKQEAIPYQQLWTWEDKACRSIFVKIDDETNREGSLFASYFVWMLFQVTWVRWTRFMNEYIKTGHMSLVIDENLLRPEEHCFSTHLAVIRPDSLLTKVRCVFDNIRTLTLRLRSHEFIVIADIVKMFRQIFVDEAERKWQLILSRKDSNKPVQVYQRHSHVWSSVSFL